MKFLTSKSIAGLMLILLCTEAYSQTVSRYIILHRNKRNESIVKPSPLASGYDKSTAIEFSFEPIPTEAMKRLAKRVIDNKKAEDCTPELNQNNILGDNSFSIEEISDLLNEINEETAKAIETQEQQDLAKQEELKQQAIASYTFEVKAKKNISR